MCYACINDSQENQLWHSSKDWIINHTFNILFVSFDMMKRKDIQWQVMYYRRNVVCIGRVNLVIETEIVIFKKKFTFINWPQCTCPSPLQSWLWNFIRIWFDFIDILLNFCAISILKKYFSRAVHLEFKQPCWNTLSYFF